MKINTVRQGKDSPDLPFAFFIPRQTGDESRRATHAVLAPDTALPSFVTLLSLSPDAALLAS